jgi:hypothetical protein
MVNGDQYRERLAFWTAILFLAVWYFYFFGHVILSPNSVLHAGFDDGLKNYYTFAYQAGNTGTSLHFKGMNYPYGEHVIFTDGIPLLGFLVGSLPFIKGYEVGILNVFIYLSVLWATVLIWKIFRKLNVEPWAAAAGVVGIVVLSPQFFRLGSHYGLSFMWVIPLIILQLMALIRSGGVLRSTGILSLTILLLFFIHPYMGLMSLVFAAATLLIWIIVQKGTRLKGLYSLMIVGLSAVFFRTFLLFTDLHPERTEKPQGLYENFALPETVFVPYFSPFKGILELLFPIREGQPFEGWGYIGLSVMLVVGLSTVWWGFSLMRRKKAVRFLPAHAAILFFAALIVLLFAMLIPIKWLPEDFIYKLKVFNQFRSVGRFSWVFYYMAGITAVFILDQWWKRSEDKMKVIPLICVIAFPILNISEAWEGTDFFSRQIGRTPNLFAEKGLEKHPEWEKVIQLVKREKSAVLLPLPFFHVGAEQFMRKGSPEIQQMTMVISYHSATPTMASFLSRTSEPETRDLFGLIAPELNPHISLNHNRLKNVLIITNGEQLDPNEKKMLDNAKKLYKGRTIALYRLDLRKYAQKERTARVSMQKKLIDLGIQYGKSSCSDTNFLIHRDFDTLYGKNTFSGKGSLSLQNADYLFLETVNSRGDHDLEASFWFLKGAPGSYNPLFVIEEIDTLKNTGQWKYVTDPKRSPVIRGDWAYIQLPMTIRKGPFRYNVLIVGNSKEKDQWFCVDELMVRERNVNILTPVDRRWGSSGNSLNNVPIGN